jgi:hypothetical protein
MSEKRELLPRKRYRPEEIIDKLREADVLPSLRKTVAAVAMHLGVTEVACWWWYAHG